MEAQLPYKSVVIFIACGAMVSLIVFIFVKRQITRFALKSKRVPHAAIGASAPKCLRREIEKRFNRVEDIKYEPLLLSDDLSTLPDYENCDYYYRMKAVDSLKQFDSELHSLYPSIQHCHGSSLRSFLLDQQLHDTGCLHGIKLEVIDKFAQMYEHARHDPSPFQQEQYQEMMDLITHLVDHMKNKYNQTAANSRLDLGKSGTTVESSSGQQGPLLSSAPAVAATVAMATIDGDDDISEIGTDFKVKESEVIYRGRGFKGSDSGTFLLTSRMSGSEGSGGSTLELETRFCATGSESHV